MTRDLLPEIEDALDTWQEGLSQFMYGPVERQRLTAILRAKLFAFTRPAPDLPEIVAAAEAWVEAERTIFHAGSERQADETAHGITAARTRFLALVAAHAAEVAKVLEPFAEAIRKIEKSQNYGYGLATLSDCVTDDYLRAAADLRRRVTGG